MKQYIIEQLKKHNDKLVFDDENHSYTYKEKVLTPVSSTLEFFKKGMENIPKDIMDKAVARGNTIHNIAEAYVNFLIDTQQPVSYEILKEYAALDPTYKDSYDIYLTNLYVYLNEEFNKGWLPLMTETKVFSTTDKIAGTIDLLLYQETKDYFVIKISDYKTGNLRVSNYAQVGIYQFLLKKVLKGAKQANKPIKVLTDLISLKDLEIK